MFDPHYWPSLYPGIFIGLAMGWSLGGWIRIVAGALGGLAGAAIAVASANLVDLDNDFLSFLLLVLGSSAVAYGACALVARIGMRS